MKVWFLLGLTLTGCVAVMDTNAVRFNQLNYVEVKGCQPFILSPTKVMPEIPKIDERLLTNRDKIEEILVASIREHREALIAYRNYVEAEQHKHLTSCYR